MPAPNIKAAFEKSFKNFTTAKKLILPLDEVIFSATANDKGTTISIAYPDSYEIIRLGVEPFVRKLKKEFNFVKKAKGDDFTTRLTIPAGKVALVLKGLK